MLTTKMSLKRKATMRYINRLFFIFFKVLIIFVTFAHLCNIRSIFGLIFNETGKFTEFDVFIFITTLKYILIVSNCYTVLVFIKTKIHFPSYMIMMVKSVADCFACNNKIHLSLKSFNERLNEVFRLRPFTSISMRGMNEVFRLRPCTVYINILDLLILYKVLP